MSAFHLFRVRNVRVFSANKIRISGFLVSMLVGSIFAQWNYNGSKIYYNNGFVGIGTNNPGWSLDLKTSTNLSCYARVNSPAANECGLVFTKADLEKWYFYMPGNSQDLRMYYNGDKFSVKSDGKVVIGNPDVAHTEKLFVDGKIGCTGVTINNWTIEAPDYVFEEDYKLRKIEDVEKFIETNKHLPEVPSAKAMKENGVDLAEMNMLLLKKVEELTLYVIQQDKKISSLEEKIGKENENN